MGANAQTTVPTFTAGQILTADQQNQSARTGVPVFADTTARDAAFGGTGEKTLAEGQLCYVENLTGIAQLQYYDGASWQSLTPGGMVFLTGATFTTATSASLPNSTFTSTYRNYRLQLQVTALTADADFTMRMRASGTDDSTSNYDNIWYRLSNGGVADNIASIAQTAWNMGEQDNTNVWHFLTLDVLAPQVADQTFITGSYGYINKANNAWFQAVGSCVFRDVTQFDSLSFISSVASSMTGNYRVYGYLES